MAATCHQKRLTTGILSGMALGIICGVLFGEACAPLSLVGNAFIRLMQMTVLPYIMVALIHGIGRYTLADARRVATKAGLIMALFWVVPLLLVAVMSLSFPNLKTASFYSGPAAPPPEPESLINTYIPANPFQAMANTVVPAVVFFSLCMGIALIGLEKKQPFLDALELLLQVFARIVSFVTRLAPVGVFALTANAAGTVRLENLALIGAYLFVYLVAAVLLVFWIVPWLVRALTPCAAHEVGAAARDAMILAFSTSSVFVVLPLVADAAKKLLARKGLAEGREMSPVDVLLPVAYTFPQAGRLLLLLFIPFAAWFFGRPLDFTAFADLLFTGFFSLFSGMSVAIPFLLNHMRLPSDYFDLYMIADVLVHRFACMVTTMTLMAIGLAGACRIAGRTPIRKARLARGFLVTCLLVSLTVGASRQLLAWALKDVFHGAERVAAMRLHDPVPSVVHWSRAELAPPPDAAQRDVDSLTRIRARGVLRVGYLPERLPFAFRNAAGDLVGFDIQIAHQLARSLGVTVEFIPIDYAQLAADLDRGLYDVAMAPLAYSPELFERLNYTLPVLDLTIAVLMRDHEARRYRSARDIAAVKGLQVAHDPTFPYAAEVQQLLPRATLVELPSIRYFVEHGGADVFVTTAEEGYVWTLQYPEFEVVMDPRAEHRHRVAYAVARPNTALLNYINHRLAAGKDLGMIPRQYDYWIMGKDTFERTPRWCVFPNLTAWFSR